VTRERSQAVVLPQAENAGDVDEEIANDEKKKSSQ
jgi:hypothetical protein